MKHDANCEWRNGYYVNKECWEFSTDGTRLGAEIAHQMGTMDEEEIKHHSEESLFRPQDVPLTGMEEEQADWEEDDEGWKW